MSARDAKVHIRFFDEHGEYAGRFWHHVPRVGDEIMLNAGRNYQDKADESGKVAFRVKRVVWGTEGPDDPFECVNIELELAS